MKNRPRSDSHRDATLAWLRESPANYAALLDAARETGDAGDLTAALELIADAGLPSVKGRD
jgi:DNA-binding phage protein